MVVLMMLLLALKLASGGVHHTCGGSHGIFCTPVSAGGLNLLPGFLKGGGPDQISIFRRVFWEREVTFFRRGSNFYVTNKLKSEIFNKISLQTKMFFAVITYNLNWDILTKNLVIFKR